MRLRSADSVSLKRQALASAPLRHAQTSSRHIVWHLPLFPLTTAPTRRQRLILRVCPEHMQAAFDLW
jgi:hypothetical protein